MPREYAQHPEKPVSDDVAAAMAVAARALHTPPGLDETLAAIVETARRSLAGIDAVGISILDRDGTPTTRAATSQLVWDLDRIQYDLNEGPCVDGLKDTVAGLVTAPDIGHDQRWPRYVAQAVGRGLRSQLAVKIYLDEDGTVGGLNLYSTSNVDIDPEVASVAELFATHAANALGNAREVEGLNVALRSRKVIGQALGMLMNEYTLTEDAAFGFLVKVSSHSNVKIRDIAANMVAATNEKAGNHERTNPHQDTADPETRISAEI
jgi:GAF domain-containing protein